METTVDRIKIKGLSLKDLLRQDFVDALEKEGLKLDFVNLFSFNVIEKEKNQIMLNSITVSHTKRDDVLNKILSVEAVDENDLTKMKNALGKIFPK